MRLINTETRKFEEFLGKDIPRYYILSHRWGPDEITYKDYVKRSKVSHVPSGTRSALWKAKKEYSPQPSPGQDKVDDFCKFVYAKHGPSYIWIDTCCIDKRSSAELSQAINSMWDWYQRAAICYVHLADFTYQPNARGSWPENLRKQFEYSEWFTRGWTLQELLAPDTVIFLNCEWQEIGYKTLTYNTHSDKLLDLGKSISHITGIGVEYLASIQRIKTASAACKLSWAARRKTTRVEDEAYCLLGLLGINMPLLYGEGNRAFRRLQEELISTSEDDSIFMHDLSIGPLVPVLAPDTRFFITCGNIAFSDEGQSTHSYAMTNKGLQLRSKVRRYKLNNKEIELVGVQLSCTRKSEHLMLYLTRRRGQQRWEKTLFQYLPLDERPADITDPAADLTDPAEQHNMVDLLIKA